MARSICFAAVSRSCSLFSNAMRECTKRQSDLSSGCMQELTKPISRCLGLCLGLATFISPCTILAQSVDTVRAYATFCYEAANLNIDKDDFKGPFNCMDSKANKLNSFADNMPLPQPGHKYYFDDCDAPAWLLSGDLTGHQCYDNTYIQILPYNGANKGFKGALLCRHKYRASTRDDDFDDVAMILYNKATGATCYFQTTQGILGGPPGECISGDNGKLGNPCANDGVCGAGGKCRKVATVDGRTVPAPHQPAATAFWQKPSLTADDKCALCHDNGPWMNSVWLYTQFPEFHNQRSTLKSKVIGTAFAGWKNFSFMTVGGLGLKDATASSDKEVNDTREKVVQPCTSCHRLSAAVNWGTTLHPLWNQTFAGPPQPAGAAELGGWFDWSTGGGFLGHRPPIPQANTDIAKSYDYEEWMPTGGRPEPSDPKKKDPKQFYKDVYGQHFRELKTCMMIDETARGMTKTCGGKFNGKKCDPGVCAGGEKCLVVESSCRNWTTNIVPPPPNEASSQTPDAYLLVSVNGGAPYIQKAEEYDDQLLPSMDVSLDGDRFDLSVEGQVDGSYDGCTIQVTYPPAVMTTRDGSNSFQTADNWDVKIGRVDVGYALVPGKYYFTMYCSKDDADIGAQIAVELAGQPPSMVRLNTALNNSVKDIALNGFSPGAITTTTYVTENDWVEMSWTAYNVIADSCKVTEFSPPGVPTGRYWIGDVGSVSMFYYGGEYTYSYICSGDDGVTRNVTATLLPASGDSDNHVAALLREINRTIRDSNSASSGESMHVNAAPESRLLYHHDAY
jgi:hypothetical protein